MGMQVINNKSELYSCITDKKYSSARDYLSSTYGQPKVRYYNDITTDEKKEKKKADIRFIALVIGIVSILVGISAQLIKQNQYHFTKFGKLFSEKSKNCMSNFLNIKDDYWDKFAKKAANVAIFNKHPFAFIDKIGQKMTGLYKKSVYKSFEADWEEQRNIVLKMAQDENVKVNIPEFKSWYNSTYENIYKNLHIPSQRVTDNLINKDIIKTVTKGNIADGKIAGVKEKAFELIEMPNNASSRLKEQISDMNGIKLKTAKIVVPKLRDITAGSAPTDLLTQLISVTSLGTVIATSDTTEKKQFVLIRLGIPLITAVTTTTIATLKAISGSSALLFGLILGEIASFTAKGISDRYMQKHKNKKEVV